jgi:tight adherence protein B
MRYLDLTVFFICAVSLTTLLIQFTYFFFYKKNKNDFIKKTSLKRLERQVPLFLDAVSSGLSSGNSLLQSIETAGEKTSPPLGTIIQQLIESVQTGMTLESSLEKTAQQLREGSMFLVLHSMAASYRSGGNMVYSLSLLAEVCREREALQEKILARSAQSRMQGTVLILVPFFFLLLLLITSPQNLFLVLYSSLGKKILLSAFFLQSMGIIVIKKLLKQDILG